MIRFSNNNEALEDLKTLTTQKIKPYYLQFLYSSITISDTILKELETLLIINDFLSKILITFANTTTLNLLLEILGKNKAQFINSIVINNCYINKESYRLLSLILINNPQLESIIITAIRSTQLIDYSESQQLLTTIQNTKENKFHKFTLGYKSEHFDNKESYLTFLKNIENMIHHNVNIRELHIMTNYIPYIYTNNIQLLRFIDNSIGSSCKTKIKHYLQFNNELYNAKNRTLQERCMIVLKLIFFFSLGGVVVKAEVLEELLSPSSTFINLFFSVYSLYPNHSNSIITIIIIAT